MNIYKENVHMAEISEKIFLGYTNLISVGSQSTGCFLE
jgi:hypothetical protein